jgi:hypothetical protein
MLFTPVESFHASAPTAANLLASAVPATGSDDRWMEGFGFRGELCPNLQVFGPCDSPDLPAGDTSRVVYVEPMGYRVQDTCTTLERGFDEARVTRLANAVASYAVARELADGAGTQGSPFIATAPDGSTMNPYLSDPNVIILPDSGSTTVTSELDAIGVLEQAAREQTKGQQVFLHLPIRLITRIGAQLRRVGNEIRTHTDAIVIADSGYSGNGPSDGGTREVQTVTITGAPTGGTFTLHQGAAATGPIAWNASAATVQAALVLDAGLNVAVTGSGPYTVTFQTPGNVAAMTAVSSLTGGTTPGVTVTTATPGVTPAPLAGIWAYATGPVEVRLSPVISTVDMAVTVNRQTNERQVWADRMFAAAFDPCCQYGIVIPPA